MSFRTEKELVEHSAPLLQQWLQPQTGFARVGREVGVGRNIADLVLLLQDDQTTSPTIGSLTTGECVVLASLRRYGATRIDLLEERCGLRRTQLRVGALSRLLEWGLVRKGRGGAVALRSNSSGTFSIVAIEAKLTRWKQAMSQAVQYFRYADLSYVLLPEGSAAPALANTNAFVSSGVGLLVANNLTVTPVIGAQHAHDHDWRREFVYSRMLQEDKGSRAK